jgi:hypothetical protein
MRSLQFSETLTFISLALMESHKGNEILTLLKQNFQEEQLEIEKITNEFYNEIEKRFKMKEKSRLSTFNETEKNILKMKEMGHQPYDDVFADYKTLQRNYNMKQIQFLSQELTNDELISLVKAQSLIQQKKIKERKKMKQEDIDPLASILKLKSFQYLTFEQKLFYQRKSKEIYEKKIKEWKTLLQQSLTVSPKILSKNIENLPMVQIGNESFTPNWSTKEWSTFFQSTLNNVDSLNEKIFPEKPWDGDHQTLQVLFFV